MTTPTKGIIMPLVLATLAKTGKRVMAYTMPGLQANRGTMAEHPLAVTMLVKAGKRVMS
jgi:hypothetical protein